MTKLASADENSKTSNLRFSQKESAEIQGVSKTSVETASKVVQQGAPEIVKAVEAGDVSISDAKEIVDLPKAEQKKIAAKAKREGTTLKQAAKELQPEETAREWCEGDSLEDVQADLRECAERIRAAGRFFRKVIGAKGSTISRPYCRYYSTMLIGELNGLAQTVENGMPVGGTPKKPKLFLEQKVEELAG